MGLSCTIYKIPVNSSGFLARRKPGGTGNSHQWYRKFLVVSVKAVKKVKHVSRMVISFYSKNSKGMNCFIRILTGNTGFSIQMVSAYSIFPTKPHELLVRF